MIGSILNADLAVNILSLPSVSSVMLVYACFLTQEPLVASRSITNVRTPENRKKKEYETSRRPTALKPGIRGILNILDFYLDMF